MGAVLRQGWHGGRVLLVVAAPNELLAMLAGFPARADGVALPEPWRPLDVAERATVLLTGVSKSNAAGATAQALATRRYAGVVNLGIAGRLPGESLALGSVIVADRSVFADEGAQTPAAFVTCVALGFPLAGPCAGDESEGVDADGDLAMALMVPGAVRGRIATVSTCSGTDALAVEVARRTRARCEAMEGAAAGLACLRFGVPFAEVRVLSNTTGDRDRQAWDIPLAMAGLTRLVRAWMG